MKTLKEALRTAADNIEGGAAYDWYSSDKCTLGHLHAALVDDPKESRDRIVRTPAVWKAARDGEVVGCVADLVSAGLTLEQIAKLEDDTNPGMVFMRGLGDINGFLALGDPAERRRNAELQGATRIAAVSVLRELAEQV